MLRHGQTKDNMKRLYPRDNDQLSLKGRSQIENIKAYIRKYPYEDIYYSPLLRTFETKEILQVEAREEEAIKETDFGIFKGYSFAQAYEKYKDICDEWMADYMNYQIPNGESLMDTYNRVRNFISSLQRDTLLICHGGVIRCAIAFVFDSPQYFYKFEVDNASISQIVLAEDHKYISCLNHTY